MQKLLKRFFLCGTLIFLDTQNHIYSGKTFFKSIMPFMNASCERVSLYDHVKNADAFFNLQVTPFYATSMDFNKLSSYFMLWNDMELVCGNNDDFYKDPNFKIKKDIDTTHFNFPLAGTDNFFHSILEFNLEEIMYGVGLLVRRNIYRSSEDINKLSIEFSLPIVVNQHKISINENIYKKLERAIPKADTMKEAFNAPFLKHGKIQDGQVMKKTGIADINVSCVYTSDPHEICSTETYLGFTVPTGNKQGEPNCTYDSFLWQPIIGNGGHWGLFYGNNLEIIISNKYNRKISFMVHSDTAYLFKNLQKRIFELNDKSLSRYMKVFPSKSALKEGTEDTLMNHTYLKCDVYPGFKVSSTASFVYKNDFLNLVAGYNFFVQEAESLYIKAPIPPLTLVGAKTVDDLNKKKYISSARNIMMRYSCDDQEIDLTKDADNLLYEFLEIRERDINKDSAAHPAIFSGTVFGYLETSCCIEDNLFYAGLGASYRIEGDNSHLPTSMIWLTFHYDY